MALLILEEFIQQQKFVNITFRNALEKMVVEGVLNRRQFTKAILYMEGELDQAKETLKGLHEIAEANQEASRPENIKNIINATG